MKKRAAATQAPGIPHVVDASTPALRASSRRSSEACLSSSRRLRNERSGRWPATSAPPIRCTACSKATSERARRSWHSRACSTASRVGIRGRSWSRPRCWPSSTSWRLRAFSAGLEVCGLDPDRRSAPAGGGTAHEPHHRRRALAYPVRAARRQPRPGRRHPRPAHRRHPVPLARGGRDRRAAPFRGRAARGAPGEGSSGEPANRRPAPSRAPATPTCS